MLDVVSGGKCFFDCIYVFSVFLVELVKCDFGEVVDWIWVYVWEDE